MALINTSIKPFKTQAFHNGKFISAKETEGPKLVARPDSQAALNAVRSQEGDLIRRPSLPS